MIKPKLKWDWDAGEGKVVFPKEFEELNWIVKADALIDWIADFTDKYNSLFTDEERAIRCNPKTKSP